MEKTLHFATLELNFINCKKWILLFTVMLFSFNLSNSQNQNSNVDGGTISTTDDTTLCLNGNTAIIDVSLTGASGRLSQWIITDDSNNILSLPDAPPFDFGDSGNGVCRIWHLSYNGIPPFRHIQNLNDMRGRFDLSNYIVVNRNQPEGGTLEGGPFEFTVGDGIADFIPEGAITLTGNSGGNSQWVITDSEGNILGLPPTPYVVDFDGAGVGTCLVWHLSFEDGIEGAMVGENASDLKGCFDLSNSLKVIRTGAMEVDGGKLEGGPWTFCVGDDFADNIPDGSITLTDNIGENSQWVITDSDGNILGLPASPYDVDFDGAGAGACLVWHLSFNGTLEGAEVGNNAADLVGDFSLSNPLTVNRNQPEGGTLEGGPFEFTVGDGIADFIPEGAIILTGNSGGNSQWVITDSEGNILGLPPTPYVVDFDGAGVGTCLVWHLSFEDGIEGAMVGENAANLKGCFDLSNPLEVIRTEATDVEGGNLEGGPWTFCVGDGVADNIPDGSITLTDNIGENSQWVITDSDGNILGLPASPYDVDFDGAGAGACLVWHLSFNGTLEGAEVGNNAADLVGDFSLSNALTVNRNQPEGGTLEGGPFEFTVGDGIADFIPEGAITRTGTVGEANVWVIVDSNEAILTLPGNIYQYNFEETGPGICYVVNASVYQPIRGYGPGNTVEDIVGCFDVSNKIEVRKIPQNNRLTIYPNPAENVFNIDLKNLNDRNASIEIYNIQNVEVYHNSLNNLNPSNDTATIDVSDFQKGIYFVRMITQNGQNLVQKLIIK